MKKLLIIALLALSSVNAGAQLFTGLSFDINWANNGTEQSGSTGTSQVTNAYSGTISPQIGYQFNPKFMTGGRLNFLFDKSYSTQLIKSGAKDSTVNSITSSIGWDVAPFCRYKIAEMGKNGWFSIWADAHAYYGMMYPTNITEPGYISQNFKLKHIYGIQAMPSLGFKINEKSTLFVNVAILSLAYSGTCTTYDDGRIEYDNKAVLFTGKLSGLLNAATSEGMYSIKFGMIRKF